MLTIFILSCLISLTCSIRIPGTVDIDLDLPPSARYVPAIQYVVDNFGIISFYSVFSKLNNSYGYTILPSYFYSNVSALIQTRYPEHAQELAGIQATLVKNGLPVTFEYLCGIVYWELLLHLEGAEYTNKFHGCSGVLIKDQNGKVTHGRNMDWENLAQNLTLVLNYKRNGQVVLRAPGWYWFVGGVETGIKDGVLTVETNFRSGTYTWDQLMQRLFSSPSQPTTWMVRDIALNSPTYLDALNQFETYDFLMPSYFVLSGALPGEGAAVATAPNFTRSVYLGDVEPYWYLVQTNYDHWLPDNMYDPRRTMIEAVLSEQGQELSNTFVGVYASLTNYPYGTYMTVYRTVMSVADGVLNIWIANNYINAVTCVSVVCPAICSNCTIYP
jgi:hypothetical protein